MMLAARSDGERGSRPRIYRWLPALAVLLLLGVVSYVTVQYERVDRQSHLDETQKANAIFVLGAAEYAGKPSPIYRARLEHAASLFQRGFAPVVITSGGPGGEASFTEGQVGRDYLASHGISESHLIAETQSKDTAESAVRVAKILRTNGMTTCLAVSDGYHMYRVKKMLEAQGIKVYGAPRPETRPTPALQKVLATLNEVFKYTLWKLHLDMD